ncbi:NAD-dependent succinate-semialdehyde dehydrogenase [Cytophaga aurantiaca]|uniref:NAD-dependent succinate-semialdehyde dehydrogenase n=1 Tax=Cytophaga aurantiaca TaxID=29530 RepID=UPI000361883C|nr:NAD-dependent succinate-semialdehyde dehydrogenase [Cytophaga aurantiaca]
MIVSHNPYTSAITFQGTFDTAEELKTKLALSQSTYSYWKNTPLSERKDFFDGLSHLMEEEKSALALLISNEMGKPILESIAEIEKCIGLVRWYVDQAESFLQHSADLKMNEQNSYSYIQYEPIGCILGIMPWNFPFWQVFRFAIPTLLAGNIAILKHAPNVQGCASAMQSLFERSGFKPGTFLSAFASVEDIEILISSPIIQGVSFTGSEKAGRAIAKTAGTHLKKCVLELGGSDPFIVLADANISSCVKQAIKSRLVNNGQSCIAAKRFIIHADCYDRFMHQLSMALSSLKLGPPLLADTDLGPMARPDLKEQLKSQVDKTIAAGASVYYTHPFNDSDSNFFSPIILENIPADSPARKEELFGPVFTCIWVSSEQEAIEIANETSFGLSASIWTNNIEHAKQLCNQIESGSVFINDMVRSDARIPFGGIKNSGYGRELSIYGMHEFVNIKTHWVSL